MPDPCPLLHLECRQPFFAIHLHPFRPLELLHRLTKEETDLYFKTRAAQGFNVIQAVALAEMDGLHTPNAYGEIPLENDDPLRPREAFFQHIDYVIDLAAQYHLYIGFLPTWGDKLNKSTWGMGPEIFNAANAYEYGWRWRYVANATA